MNNQIIEEIMSHDLTKKIIQQAIKESKPRFWVLDEIADLIEGIDELDDCTMEGSLLFDELEDRIDELLGIL